MTEDFIIGTYTNKTSKGIYRVTLDEDAEHLQPAQLAVNILKPSFLQVGADHRVYTIKKAADGTKGVACYQLDSDAASARLLGEALFDGPSPAYVGLDEKRHLLFGANYHGSRIDVFKISQDGQLTRTDSVIHDGATGPRPEQAIPHVHYADLTPDGRLITCDLGEDLITIYDITADGKLTEVSHFQDDPGFGTRHLAFHPNGKSVYVLGELSSELEVLKYDTPTAQLTRLQKVKTIPASWTAHNGAGAIHLSSDGRFVYTSNRGENTIAVFAIQPDFTVKHIQSISSEGDFPRDFNLSRDERYLVVANQNTDNLSLYRRNLTTGRLSLLQKNVHCPEPICVQRY